STTDLPTTLAGRSLVVADYRGNEKTAQLFYVSPSQINYLMPAGLAESAYITKIIAGNQVVRASFMYIAKVIPGVFTANANGDGVAAAVVVRTKPDGSQQYESMVSFDTAQNKYVATPIDLGSETDRVVLVLFGTGWRNQSSLSAFSVKIGGTDAQVQFAGKQPMLPGLDQLNALIPRSLIGSGEGMLSRTSEPSPDFCDNPLKLRPQHRVNLETLIEIPLRFRLAPLLQIADAAIEEGQGAARIEDERLIVIVHRSRQIAASASRIAAIAVGDGLARIQ